MADETLSRFLQTFHKAIRTEMEAMRAALGPFEVPLTAGNLSEQHGAEGARKFLYDFAVTLPNDKLTPHLECTLRCEKSEYLVTLTQVSPQTVQLRSCEEIPLGRHSYALIIYPWFLYEKLQLALEALGDGQSFHIHNALSLFGKHAPRRQCRPVALEHTGLNASQLAAVQLCCDSSLSFVWGPPGTGKTTTLAHIVAELLEQNQRILVTSTTNAAVDQALDQLVQLPQNQSRFDQNEVIRLGQTTGETYGVSLGEVVARRDRSLLDTLEHMSRRRLDLRSLAGQIAVLTEQSAKGKAQIDLFAPEALAIGQADLQRVFSPALSRLLITLPRSTLQTFLGRRTDRLERLGGLYDDRIEQMRQVLLQRESGAVSGARLVLATMSNVYVNKLLQAERFDAVIVEEAGMAILPILFYCAALASDKIIAVGDPRQLPSIVQSRDPFVRRAMGRSIFAVTVPHPLESDLVALLDTQYRMHPRIGELVSELFYEGQLHHGENTCDRANLAAHAPFAGQALVVVDTAGQTTCATTDGSYSRRNKNAAALCVALARAALEDGLESIGIITPYVEQAKLIRSLLSASAATRAVECSTVHRFQGHEKDLIILDTTDAAPLPPGVLLDEYLLNVSVSRARGKLLIVTDFSYYRHRAPDGIVHRLLECARRTGTCVAAPLPASI